MIASIHQPHYFPWLGYVNKMLKCDIFVVLDEVQLETSSVMMRNKFLDSKGNPLFLSVDIKSKGYLNKKTNEIEVLNMTKWQRKHMNFFLLNYKKSPFFDEIFPKIKQIFEKNYNFLIDVEMDTINFTREAFNINNKLVMQRELEYNRETKNNEMLIEILKSISCNQYLSGNGAKKYMNISKFNEQNIQVAYQNFKYPEYKQYNSSVFIPNLSALDMLFNLGFKESQQLVRKNIVMEEYM